MSRRKHDRCRRILAAGIMALACVLAISTYLAADRSGAAPRLAAPAALRVEQADGSRELIAVYGPIHLPRGASHGAVEQIGPHTAAIPLDAWLHGFEVDIIDAAGRPVPRTVLHHVNLMLPDGRELFSQIMRRIGAAGHETAPVRLPRLIGHPVRRGEPLLVTAMMHNPTEQTFDAVYVRTRIPYTRRPARLPRLPVFPFYLDVMPPAGKHAFDLPPGRSEHSWEGRPGVGGRVLGVGGHLHRYGELLRLEDVTAGRVLWEARPKLDEEGNVIGMPTRRFFWRLGLRLRTDHVYRLTAIYDNPTGRVLRDGGMGALGGIFVPRRGAKWPAVDREHPEYLLDLATVYDSSHEHGDAAADGADDDAHHHH